MSVLLKLDCEAQQLLLSLILEHYGTSAEENRSLHLGALLEEALGMLEFELEIVFVRIRAEAYFLDNHLCGVGLHFLCLLLALVKVLLIVHYLAHGRIRIRANLHQVQFELVCNLQSLGQGIYPLLWDIVTDQSHLRCGNLVIDIELVLVFFAVSTRVGSATARLEARRLGSVRSCYGLILLIFKFVGYCRLNILHKLFNAHAALVCTFVTD